MNKNPHDGSTLDNFLLEEENKRLRKVISQIATNLGNGSVVSEQASIEFIEELPYEVKLVCDGLRREIETYKVRSFFK
jgi:hypothetical protein